MKILFCPAHFRYTKTQGSEYYSAYQLVHRIATRFPSSVVVTGKSEIKDVPYKVNEVCHSKPENWQKDMSQWSTFKSIDFAFRYMWAGFRLIQFDPFDIIHHVRPFNIGRTFNLIPIFPVSKKTPFVIGEFCSPYTANAYIKEKNKSWSSRFSSLILFLFSPIQRFLSTVTLRRADAILVTDEETKAYVRKYVVEDKIYIIPHGKDKDEFRFDLSKFSDEKINILVAGFLITRKRIDLAIEAFALAYEKNPRLHLNIVGDGIERKVLKSLVTKLKLELAVDFVGSVPYPKMRDIFAKSHLLLHCAREEMFAHVYLEALASGVPVVSTNTIGARNIVTPDVGIIVDGEESKLSDAILSIIDEEEKLLQMSKKARERFEKNYDLDDVVIPKVLDIYRKILNK